MKAPHARTPVGHRPDGTLAAFCGVTEKLLAVKSFRELTVAEIISRTPYARSSFYHYFAGKDDVLVALAGSVYARALRDPSAWAARLGAEHDPDADSWGEVIQLWSRHGAVLGAVIEEMHAATGVAALWQAAADQVIAAVADQIRRRRSTRGSVEYPPADTMAAVLVCGIERTLYVVSRGLEPRFPTPGTAIEALDWLATAALNGAAAESPRFTASNRSTTNGAALDGNPGIGTQTDAFVAEVSAGAILEATRVLLLDYSIDKLSVSRITRQAGVSRSTFYFYFENKEAAFVALYRDLADSAGTALHRLHDIERSDGVLLREVLDRWLRIDDHSVAVMRSALHEWPRTPELRDVYQAGMAAQVASLESVIEKDRARGLAPQGPPAGELASTVLWTAERAIAGALAGQKYLSGLDSVIPCLVELVISTIYGRR